MAAPPDELAQRDFEQQEQELDQRVQLLRNRLHGAKIGLGVLGAFELFWVVVCAWAPHFELLQLVASLLSTSVAMGLVGNYYLRNRAELRALGASALPAARVLPPGGRAE